MKKKFLSILGLIVLTSVPAVAQDATDYGLPDKIEDGNILHCFNWSINEVRQNLRYIAESGFGAVQLSPLQRKDAMKGDPWNDLYRPYDLSFQESDAMGTQEELEALCKEAEQLGIKVIVDVVANHVDKLDGYHLPWWEQGAQQPRLRTNPDATINYSNRTSITTGLIGDYAAEINSEATAVLQKAKSYVTWLAARGVKGIRWDAAKHIGLPSENSNFWPTVTEAADGMFHYGEILDNPCSGNYGALVTEYAQYMAVTDTYFSNEAARYNNGIPTKKNGEYALLAGKDKLIYWAESHDTYSNTAQFGGWSNTVEQSVINRAYAAIACRDGATALYLARPGDSGFSNIKLGKTSTDAQDQQGFRNKVVAEVNKFRNAMVGREEYFTKSDDGKTVCIARNNGGAVIITEPNTAFSVPNGGSYCPVISSTGGKIRDKISNTMITVTPETISGTADETGVVVIYVTSMAPKVGVEVQDFDSLEMTIYYDNTETEWEDVYCYYWHGATESTFPGVKMQPVESDGFRENLYSITVPSGSHALFNQGSRSLPQTVNSDGVVEDGHVYRGLTETTDADGMKHNMTDTGVYGTEPDTKPAGITIYYDNSETQYAVVCCHYWGGESQTSFPGVEMTQVKGDIYTITLPNNTSGILFAEKDRSKQTVNVTTNIIDGYIFKGLSELNGTKNKVADGIPYEGDNDEDDEPEERTVLTIYYDNTDTAYDPVYCYYWGGDATGPNFPGTEMTHVEGNIFTIDVPLNSSVNFNNNNQGKQTENVTKLEDYHVYKGLTDTNDRGRNLVSDMGVYTPPVAKVTVYVHAPSAPYLYVWDEQNTLNGAWPGTQMDDSTVAFGDNLYFVKEFEGYEMINLILNAGPGGYQTGNFEGLSGNVFLNYNLGSEAELVADPASPLRELEGGDFITIYYEDIDTDFTSTGIAGKVHCHYFGDGIVDTQWPGVEMERYYNLSVSAIAELEETSVMYKVEVPKVCTVIFNNGGGSQNRQSVDLTSDLLNDNTLYIGKSETDSSSGNHLLEVGDVISDKGSATSIENVRPEAQAEDSVYFNLQGIRVSSPTAGQLMIRQQGNKAAKVIVR